MLNLKIKFGWNWASTFQKIIQILYFPPNLTSDYPWPWYMIFDLINIQRNPHCIFDPSLIPIKLFKGDPNNTNHYFPPNLTSDHPWPWYVTFDLINLWRNPVASLTQVCYKIGFIESNTQIYWSSHELRKILGETVRRAQYFSNSWLDQ